MSMKVLSALHTEVIKLKRSRALLFAVAGPLLMVVMTVLDTPDQPGALFFGSIYNIWFILVYAFYAALIIALLFSTEHQNNQWKHLFAFPVPRMSIYLAKVYMGFLLVTFGQVVLFVASLLAIWLLGDPTGLDVLYNLKILSFATAASAGMIAIQSWVSMRWSNFIVPLAVGFVGAVVNIFAFTNGLAQKIWPWMFPSSINQAIEAIEGARATYEGWSAPLLLAISMAVAIVVTAYAVWELEQRDILE